MFFINSSMSFAITAMPKDTENISVSVEENDVKVKEKNLIQRNL